MTARRSGVQDDGPIYFNKVDDVEDAKTRAKMSHYKQPRIL